MAVYSNVSKMAIKFITVCNIMKLNALQLYLSSGLFLLTLTVIGYYYVILAIRTQISLHMSLL